MSIEDAITDCPLPRSLPLIARLGIKNASAAGFAIDQLAAGGEAWIRRHAEGVSVPEADSGDLRLACFPLSTDDLTTGALSFVFHRKAISEGNRRLLSALAAAAQTVWQLWHARNEYVRRVIRIAELEAELADSKIADRAAALWDRPSIDRNPIETISHSVDSVVSPYRLGAVLDELVRDLESDLAEHRLIRTAKIVLQRRDGMSEEQAYLHLRLISRQSRKRLRDVAGEFITSSAGIF